MTGVIYTMFIQDQLSTISRYRINAGETIRVNCPFCSGKKTMSISKIDGTLKWNCFKASCKAGGNNKVGRTSVEIRNALNGISSTPKKSTLPIPEILISPTTRTESLNYLLENNCLTAFEDGACRIEYSPKENRILFFNKEGTGCIGRSLTKGLSPKWKVFGQPTQLFTVGNANHVVLVEDAASACAVYATKVYAGAALLGTHMTYKQRKLLEHYDFVTICLDKDATRKSILLSKQLRVGSNCLVRFLTNDLKTYPPERIIKVISNV